MFQINPRNIQDKDKINISNLLSVCRYRYIYIYTSNTLRIRGKDFLSSILYYNIFDLLITGFIKMRFTSKCNKHTSLTEIVYL